MTKKDYEKLARALARCKPTNPETLYLFDTIVSAIAQELRNDNHLFNPVKFILTASKPA